MPSAQIPSRTFSRDYMAIPKLPGYTLNLPLKLDYRKTTHFEMKAGQQIFTPREEWMQAKRQDAGIDQPPSSRGATRPLTIASARGPGERDFRNSLQTQFTPRFVALDKKVLRFWGYFEEVLDPSIIGSTPLDNVARKNVRVRECTILYYLEDGTIQAEEKRQDNSGMIQGLLVRRTMVPKVTDPTVAANLNPPVTAGPSSSDVGSQGDALEVGFSYYRPEDLAIGGSINLFGRMVHLVDCDAFTNILKFDLLELSRDYYANVVQRPIDDDAVYQARQTAPKDRYLEHIESKRHKQFDDARRRTCFKSSATIIVKEENRGGYIKFLQWDTKVLRFFCVWDDRQSMYGDQRKLTMRFYLADDSMDIIEEDIPNSGRKAGNFLRRARVPKRTPKTMLGAGDWFIEEYYTPADLIVGTTINIHNRMLFLYACDDFTRAYYEKNFGVRDMPEYDVEPEPLPATTVIAPVPPYTGIGSQEDSFGSVLYLQPKPPSKDIMKMLQNEKKRLRFRGEFANPVDDSDAQRRFVITYFTSDDTISVFEEPVQNSGRWHGRFLERGRVLKPESNPGEGSGVVYYELSDLQVGAVVYFHCHAFRITEIDAFTQTYLRKSTAAAAAAATRA